MTTETQSPDPAQAAMVLVDRAVLERARHTAMMSTLKARIPECGYFGEIAQDLDALLSPAEAIPAPEGAPLTLPPPDTHCWDDDTGKDVWSYSADLVRSIVSAALAAPAPQAPVALTEEALLDGFCKERHSQHYASVFIAGARFAERAHHITQTKEPTNDR